MGTKVHESQSSTCAFGGMIQGGCPTAPGPKSMSANYTINQDTPFTELLINLQITAGNNATVVCVAVLLEQTMPAVNTAVSFLPIALAAYSGLVSLTSIFMRGAVNNGFLSALATYGLATTTDIISVHTPGVFDILFYVQFMLMTGQMSINYPSFYQTFASLFHWSFLEFRNSFAGNGPDNATTVLAYGGAGSVNQMKSFVLPSSDPSLQKRLLHHPLPAIMRDTWQFPPTPTLMNLATRTTTPRQQITGVLEPNMRKRDELATSNQQLSVDPSPTTSSSSSSISPSVTTSSSVTTTTISETKTTTIKRSTTTSIVIQTTSTTVAPTPSLIKPTITDPFNTNNVSRQFNVSRFGIEAYAAAFGASPSHLFLCTFINSFLAAGVALFLSAGLLVIAWFMATENHQKGKTLQHALNFVSGNLVRVWSLLYTPLALSAMYQLTLAGRGTAMVVVAGASILIFSVGMIVFLTWRILRASNELLLFEDLGTLLKYGPIYNTLAEEGTLFFLVNLLVRFLWALSISMLSSYGVAQVAVTMAIELGYLLVIALKWPYSESGDNKFHLFLGSVRIIVTGCSIAYVHELDTDTEVRQLFGYIQMALHLTVFIVMFALVLWNMIQVVMFWRSRHTRAWKGPTKSYSFEDPAEVDQDWIATGRRASSRPEGSVTGSPRTRRYTVQPYTSMSDISQHPSLPEGSQDDLFRYRMSHQPTGATRRSRFLNAGDERGRSEAVLPLSGSAGTMSHRSSSPPPISPGSVTSMDPNVIPLQPAQSSFVRLNPPPAGESYTKFERMNHQQTPDPRTRRMSELFRDGRYLYEPSNTLGSSVHDLNEKEDKPSVFPPAVDPSDTRSQAGDDNLRELNSVGISRFFQESGRNYERNRSLFVANPEAMISQAGSLQSSVSGIPPPLNRTISAATSVYTLNRQSKIKTPSPAPNNNISADLASVLSGVDSENTSESRRVSTLSVQPVYTRNSVESNIAEAMMSEAPLKLQGGGILKVSKGPEKAVQYWHKESGQYVESQSNPGSVENSPLNRPLTSPPLLLLPTTRSPLFESIQIDTGLKTTPSIRSRAGSRPESPTESHHSINFSGSNNNVAASAGRMQEILDRMFSDQDDDEDSDVISDDEESVSTFSGRVSAAILALQQKRQQEEFGDMHSIYRSDTLEPVPEQLDSDHSGDEDSRSHTTGGTGAGGGGHLRKSEDEGAPRRTSSGTSLTRPRELTRTFSGPGPKSISSAGSSSTLLLRPSKSGSLGRPLAQTPLHSPSIMHMNLSTSTLHPPSSLSRQSSQTSIGGRGGLQVTKQDPLDAMSSSSTASSPVIFHGSVASSPVIVSRPLGGEPSTN
ncbi:hypothetical protein BGZ83_011436 [Gryganskiella cystojenkinii]|nr:hypothetical protein BGZ83_011436 [Gryganskiella cystojenkinii]